MTYCIVLSSANDVAKVEGSGDILGAPFHRTLVAVSLADVCREGSRAGAGLPGPERGHLGEREVLTRSHRQKHGCEAERAASCRCGAECVQAGDRGHL